MLTEREIYRNGWYLVKSHGPGAAAEALRAAHELSASGNDEEAGEWRQVAAAIAEIAASLPQVPEA